MSAGEEINPYNCSRPGNLFVGYESTRRQMLRKLQGGSSFALLGGRRCGKTSLLRKLEEDIRQNGLGPRRALPRFLDMQAVVPRSPLDFFRALYSTVIEGSGASPWSDARPNQHYQEFLERLDAARPALERQHGPDWVVILLIDEFDAVAAKLPDDECFQNFRNLLSSSRYSHNFRAVCSGVSGMSELIKSGSALNNLDPEYLRILTTEEARKVVAAGFPQGLDAGLDAEVLAQSGRHPYILQGLLGYLWDDREEDPALAMRKATRRFIRDRMGTFQAWSEHCGADGRAVYRELAQASEDGLAVKELRKRLPQVACAEALVALGYHGVIDESAPERPRPAGLLFKQWFLDNVDAAQAPAPPAPAPLPSVRQSAKHVFVVHGRNGRIRDAMFTFLRAIGIEPLEWSQMVEETGSAAPYIGEVLQAGFKKAQAVVVLFTPDDEARLRPDFLNRDDGEYERALSPQPRPNVLFEAGMAIALFPKRTVLVQVGPMRPLSDLSGIHVLRMNGSLDMRRQLAKRLATAECAVKLDGTDWHTAGDFSLE